MQARNGTSGSIGRWMRGVVLGTGLCAATGGALAGGHDFDAGIDIRETAARHDLGVDIYPGAVRDRDDSSDSAAVTLGLWANGSRFRLVVAEYRVDAPASDVAHFYAAALAEYGTVLDCRGHHHDSADDDNDDTSLHCGSDSPDRGGWLYKAGTNHNAHIVSITPKGSSTRFAIVHVILP